MAGNPSRRSPRRLVEQLAAHLAHLLNAGAGDAVRLEPFEVYGPLTRTLASPGYQRLIGFGLAGPETSAEQAAQRYFDAVLDRRLFLKGNEQSHKGHALLLAMCRRGVAEGWATAVLQRILKEPSAQPAACPGDFPTVAGRLAKIDHSVSPGNPAATTQAKCGPLYLEVGSHRARMPEELSVWQGITSAPEDVRKLEPGRQFDAFCSLVIKAVEAANASFAALVAIGLSPYDWAGEITTNTAKKLGAFLSDLRKLAGGDGIGDLGIWRRVWERRPVPGYATADDLWNSALGRALRFPVVARTVEITNIDDVIDQAIIRDGEVIGSDQDFAAQLAEAKRDGVIDDFDVWLLGAIRDGSTLAELRQSSQARLRLGRNGELGEYFEDLTERLYEWSRNRLAAGHPDNDGDTPEDRSGTRP